MTSAALARDREPRVRNIYLGDAPSDEARRVYVTGQVVTVLRFPQACDPERTTMLGWEGRFEPVACVGKWVLIAPLQNLEPEDRFLLRVTLADGKELPFTLTAIGEGEWERPDQQVNVFLDPESRDTLRAQLEDTRARERLLDEANRQHWKEDTEDHALAKLLKRGSVRFTSLKARQRWLINKEGMTLEATLLTGQAKAAILFRVTNRDSSKPWSLAEARLLTTRPGETAPLLFGEMKPFALQKDWKELAPGASGFLAMVVDKSAFISREGPCDLTVELYRQDGLLDAHVLLDRRLVRE